MKIITKESGNSVRFDTEDRYEAYCPRRDLGRIDELTRVRAGNPKRDTEDRWKEYGQW